MNTPVKFELAKLLKEKGFEERVKSYNENGQLVTVSLIIRRINSEKVYYPAPTIANVIMWLYEKHGIWISVNREPESDVFYFSIDKNKGDFFYDKGDDFNLPTEAYEAAIEYTLTKLI